MWQAWRPTVSICRHEEQLIDRFELRRLMIGVAGLAGAALVSTIWLRYAQRRLTVRRARLVRITDDVRDREVVGRGRLRARGERDRAAVQNRSAAEREAIDDEVVRQVALAADRDGDARPDLHRDWRADVEQIV